MMLCEKRRALWTITSAGRATKGKNNSRLISWMMKACFIGQWDLGEVLYATTRKVNLFLGTLNIWGPTYYEYWGGAVHPADFFELIPVICVDWRSLRGAVPCMAKNGGWLQICPLKFPTVFITKKSTLSPLENFPETPRILPFLHNTAYDDERGGDDDNDQTDSIDATQTVRITFQTSETSARTAHLFPQVESCIRKGCL